MNEDNMPEGYTHTPSTSAFINHIGKIYSRKWTDDKGEDVSSIAIRVQDHHVNTWGLAHGSFMAGLAEIGSSGGAYVEGGPPVVACQMSMEFIGAPKKGELMQVHGRVTRRTRSLVFTECRAESDGKLVFIATCVQKVIGA